MNSKLLLFAAATLLLPSIIFSVFITVSQVSALPNRVDTVYELGRAATRNIRIFVAQLDLNSLNQVTQVTVNYQRAAGLPQAFLFSAALLDAAGNTLSTATVCVSVPAGAGSGIVVIQLPNLVNVDSVARVRTTVAPLGSPVCI
ncbi:MAG: hypothetical protein QXY84_03200 [Candidatus Caldarchaeum sp.]